MVVCHIFIRIDQLCLAHCPLELVIAHQDRDPLLMRLLDQNLRIEHFMPILHIEHIRPVRTDDEREQRHVLTARGLVRPALALRAHRRQKRHILEMPADDRVGSFQIFCRMEILLIQEVVHTPLEHIQRTG